MVKKNNNGIFFIFLASLLTALIVYFLTKKPNTPPSSPKDINTVIIADNNKADPYQSYCQCRNTEFSKNPQGCKTQFFGSGCADNIINCCVSKSGNETDCSLYGNTDRTC
jgi:hypothetical protein